MATDEHATNDQIVYAYGVVSGAPSLAGVPYGVEDAAIVAVREGELTALCSLVAADDYTGATIEARVGDVEWVGPRAVAHDAVLIWASDHAEVVPFTMFTLFSGVGAVRSMLQGRRDALLETLARVGGAHEYTLRVFHGAVPVDEKAIADGDPQIAELKRLAADATPGQRYLLERKLDKALQRERSRRAATVAAEVVSTLAVHSVDLVRSPLPPAPDAGGGGRAVLDASCLVRLDDVDGLRSALGAMVERFGPRGFSFEFTGPWPAYHFTSASD